MSVTRLRLVPFFKDRLNVRAVATAAARAEDRGVACDVAEEAAHRPKNSR